MTQMLGGTDLVAANDMRLHNPSRCEIPIITKSNTRFFNYTNRYWPGGGFYGDMAADFGVMQAQNWGPFERIAEGAASRIGFSGVARDQFGTPLAGVTCSLFRTSDRQWIQDFTSRSDGTFTLVSWYSPDTHFIVFYKAGSPNVFGTSDQTLIGV